MKSEFLLRFVPASILSRFRRSMGLACAMLAAFSTGSAAAESSGTAEPTWICWYIRGTQVHCRVGETGAGQDSAEAGQAVAVPVGRRALPEIVHTILADPQKLVGKTISIPLFTESFDRDLIHQLAEAVMCGAKKVCSVVLLDSPTDVALTVDAIEDPALN